MPRRQKTRVEILAETAEKLRECMETLNGIDIAHVPPKQNEFRNAVKDARSAVAGAVKATVTAVAKDPIPSPVAGQRRPRKAASKPAA